MQYCWLILAEQSFSNNFCSDLAKFWHVSCKLILGKHFSVFDFPGFIFVFQKECMKNTYFVEGETRDTFCVL